MSDITLFPIVASAMIFISLLLLFTAIHFYSRYLAERRRLIARIEIEDVGFTLKEVGGNSTGKAPAGYMTAILTLFQKVGKFVKGDKSADLKGKRLVFLRAGIRSENAPLAFWGAKYVMGILFPAMFLFCRPMLLRPTKPSFTLLLCLCLVMVGFYIPDLWLKLKTSQRKEQIQDALPDALDLLVVCVEAGMGLDQALHRVGEEMRMSCPAISDEFKLFTLEVRAGKEKRDALKNLSLRTDLEDINSLVTLLIQAEKFGTSIAHSLRVYSDSFRTKRAQKAEEVAAKLPVKLMFPLGMFIFPAMFIVILGPGVIRIFRVLLPHLAR